MLYQRSIRWPSMVKTTEKGMARETERGRTWFRGGAILTMLNRSRRAKSSRLQNLVRDKILKAFKPHLRKKDVQTAPNGVNGPDILLSRIAKKLCPFNWEVKNRNQIKTVYDWMKQALILE